MGRRTRTEGRAGTLPFCVTRRDCGSVLRKRVGHVSRNADLWQLWLLGRLCGCALCRCSRLCCGCVVGERCSDTGVLAAE
eukprot:34673-Prymnesium_polylepis.2